MARTVLRRTTDGGWPRGNNDSVAGVRLVHQIRPGICAYPLRRCGADETNRGRCVRESAPSPILIRGGRAAGGAKGAESPEVVLEEDTEALSRSDHQLPSSALFHTTKKPTGIEVAGSQVLASRSSCSYFIMYTCVVMLLSIKTNRGVSVKPTGQGSRLYKCWLSEVPYRWMWIVEHTVLSARTCRLTVVLNSLALIRSVDISVPKLHLLPTVCVSFA